MRVQRTAVVNNNARASEKYALAISTHVRSIINLIIVMDDHNPAVILRVQGSQLLELEGTTKDWNLLYGCGGHTQGYRIRRDTIDFV